MKKLEKEMVIEFLEGQGCEDVHISNESRKGTTFTYTVVSGTYWNNEFAYCDITLKKIEELKQELEKQADSFNINQRICDRVMLNNGKNVYVRELLEFNLELHDNMCDMVEQCEEFIEEYIAA